MCDSEEKKIHVGSFERLRQGEGKIVDVGLDEVAVFRVGEKVYAINNRCPHLGGSLGEGFLEDGYVVCPLHGWKYHLETGQSAVNPTAKIPCWPVEVIDGEVYIKAL